MANERERTEFEKWAGRALPHTAIARRADGLYADATIEMLDKSWQACAHSIAKMLKEKAKPFLERAKAINLSGGDSGWIQEIAKHYLDAAAEIEKKFGGSAT